jgi:hypothetical protein
MPICLYPAPLAVDERKGDQRLSLLNFTNTSQALRSIFWSTPEVLRQRAS